MSIVARVNDLVAAKRLIERPSLYLGFSVRSMYLAPEIEILTRRPFMETVEGERYAELAQYLDAFSELNNITVSQNPKKKPRDTMLARVSPVEDEFWSMRITDPDETPGMRILGAFSEQDSFVGLRCDFRELMDFDDEVDLVKADWQDLFGILRPHSGSTLDAYLTNYYEQ